MKRLLSVAVTLLVLLGINFGISMFTNTNFIDFSFGIGLVASVIIWFFSSKGGFTSKYTDVMLQAETTNWKMKHEKHKFQRNMVFYTSLAYTIISVVATFIYYKDYFIDSGLDNAGNNTSVSSVVMEDDGVKIPAIQLPEGNMSADMIGLIVYNGNIYTQTSTEIDAEAAKDLIGEKLGTTKATIDEWSEQDAYDEEFASTVGKADVYSVKGYDKDFRIMTFNEHDGEIYTEFYENLNGITVNNGEDVFGKLKINGNISSAQYRTYSEWYNSIDNYQPITDMESLNTFVANLNKVKPFLRTQNSDPISNSRNDEHYRELSIKLNDGSAVRLTLLKDGYIYYGHTGAYFKMNEDVFLKLWSNLD